MAKLSALTGVAGVVLAAVAAVVGIGVLHVGETIGAVYPPPLAATPATVSTVNAAPRPEHHPARPTAVVLLSGNGTNAADVLAPLEVLAASGEYNVYTVAERRRPVPLTGGLDLVPDLSFADLRERAGGAADLVVVPAVQEPLAAVSAPLREWLREQVGGGARLLGVCVGSELLASAGLLDGRPATSHWLPLNMPGLRGRFPDVQWTEGVRYVDNGDTITTAGVLSGIDGALRALERRAGTAAAERTAAAVGWPHYSPGTPAAINPSRPAAADTVALLNAGYREPTPTGVLLTDGVGEIELASAFRPYTELSYVAKPIAVTADGRPVRSRHGLTFIPRASLPEAAPGIERLIVPGADAAGRADPAVATAAAAAGVAPFYLHGRPGFAFDGALRDIASTTDTATANWVAKSLEYPPGTTLDGPAWPWSLTARALLTAVAGGLAFATARLWIRARRARSAHHRAAAAQGPPAAQVESHRRT